MWVQRKMIDTSDKGRESPHFQEALTYEERKYHPNDPTWKNKIEIKEILVQTTSHTTMFSFQKNS